MITINKQIQLKLLRDKDMEVSLLEMLETRENRVNKQNQLLQQCESLICITMNIAGQFKTSPLIERAFAECVDLTLNTLKLSGIKVVDKETHYSKTGCEGYILVDDNPIKIKKTTLKVEESLPIGRLFDIDILQSNGLKVSRSDVDAPERSCLICKRPGAGCARDRAHSLEDLQEYTIGLICDYYNNKYIKTIAQNATKALLYEVSVSPKPGLVDMLNNGSHRDMDFFTFIDSSVVLYDYFEKCARKAVTVGDCTPQEIFQQLRYLGMVAEDEMYKATNGVNTHKGAIFSLGILSAALGYIHCNQLENSLDNGLNIAAEMASLSIEDFDNITNPKSFGEQLFKTSKLKGIRGQAAGGYEDVRNISYPLMKKLLKEGKSYNDAGVITLAALISAVEDTNIIKRSSLETLKTVQKQAKEVLESGEDILTVMEKINREYVQLNISPGGSADLLAMTFMLVLSLEE